MGGGRMFVVLLVIVLLSFRLSFRKCYARIIPIHQKRS